MTDTYCICLLKSFRSDSWHVFVLQFLFSIMISICGVFLNYKFLKKLQLERRNKPLGRKANVIEPCEANTISSTEEISIDLSPTNTPSTLSATSLRVNKSSLF